MTLFSRLFKLFIVVIITPLFVTGIFLFYYQDSGKQAILENYFNLADISSAYIKQNVEDSVARLEFLGASAPLYYVDSKVFKGILQDGVKANPDIVFAALLGKDGKELSRSTGGEIENNLPPVDISSEDFFPSLTPGEVSISYVDYSLSAPYVRVIYPLENGEYLFAVLDLSRVWYAVGMQRLGVTGGLYLVSSEGFLNFNMLSAPPVSAERLASALLKNNGLIKGIKTPEGDVFVGAYSDTVLPGIYVLALQYGKEAFYTITLTSWIIAFFILVTTTLSYFAAYIFSKEISEPAEELKKGAEKISSGDFDVSIDSSEAWGEFEILIKTFNEMASRLSVYQAVQLDKLLDEKKKIDMLAGLMRDGLIMATAEGRLLFANATANKILESDALCGDLECTLYGSMPRPSIKELAGIKSGTVFSYENDGKKRYFEIVNELFRPANQEAVSIIIFRDITAEHEIRSMKNDIFNAVAHDLRAPIMGLQAYIMILREGDLDEAKRAKMLEAMESSSNMLGALVENILDVSRLERGLLTLNKSRFDVSSSLAGVIAAIKPLAEQKGLYVKSSLPQSLEIYADQGLIERVFSNLLSNAVKFTDKGGVEISYEYLPEPGRTPKHKFSVKDTGRGIAEDELPKIFEKYHRADRSEKGYGLGLSIVRQTVLAHGGEIEAFSKEGAGCEMVFTLPEGDIK